MTYVAERQWTPQSNWVREQTNRKDTLIVYMRDMEGKTFVEIAKKLHLSNSRIRQIYLRASKARNLGEL